MWHVAQKYFFAYKKQFSSHNKHNLPKINELTEYSVILVEFGIPIEDIDVWDADATAMGLKIYPTIYLLAFKLRNF